MPKNTLHRNISHRKYFWLLMALALVSLPSIYTLFVVPPTVYMREVMGRSALFFYNIGLFLLPVLFFKISLRAYLWWFLPLVFFAPLAIFYFFIYKEMPPTWIVMSLFDTNYYEIKELFAGNEWGILAFIAVLVLYIYILWHKLPKNFYLHHKSLRWFFVVFIVAYTAKLVVMPKKPLHETIAETYPCGIIQNIAIVACEYTKITEQTTKARRQKFGAKQQPDRNTPEVYVLIVGEAARYDYWQINGFAQQTSPRLAARYPKNLLSFSDVASQSAATYTSQPMILTNAQPQNFDSIYYYKTFISAFNEANFETYWIFNDLKGSNAPSSAFYFASEAKHFISAEDILSTDHNYDGKMLPIIDSVLNIKNQPKKLLVIFTAGSHHNYSLRYPAVFDVFQPSDFGQNLPFDDKNTQKKRNSYKNSLLYTDFFIDEVIKKTQKTAAAATVLYAPDHGENLKDDARKLAMHPGHTPYDLHIPLFIWYSDLYKNTYPRIVDNLVDNQRKAATTHQIFYTLIDLAGITYPTFAPQKSLASHQYIPKTPREVLKADGKIMYYEDAK